MFERRPQWDDQFTETYSEKRERISRKQRRALASDNRRAPISMEIVPIDKWPEQVLLCPHRPESVWRSKSFLAMLFTHEKARRLTICRTALKHDDWRDEITWDELQRIKNECGFGGECAVELFPPDADVVNVANMRHLWFVQPPPYLWSSR